MLREGHSPFPSLLPPAPHCQGILSLQVNLADGSSLETDWQLGPHSSTTGYERRPLDLGHDPGRVSVTLTTKSQPGHTQTCVTLPFRSHFLLQDQSLLVHLYLLINGLLLFGLFLFKNPDNSVRILLEFVQLVEG